MEILKTLLANTFDKRIRRLENRTISQMNDLKFTKDCFNKQGKIIDKFSTINFDAPRTLKRNRTTDHLQRDISAKPLSRTNRARDNQNNTMKDRSRQKTPNIVKEKKPINSRPLRSKTPVGGGKPSYMAETASNQTKKKKEIENIYTQIKHNKEKENGLSPTSTNSKYDRSMTPDGRSLPRRGKKKTNDKEKTKVSTNIPKKIVRRNNGGENEKNQDNSIDVSPEPSKILESQNSKADDSIDNSVIKPENIKEFPKDDAPEYPKTTQISNIDELHVANINISSGKKEKVETPIDFGDFFTSPKNRENLFLITTYLNLEDRINLFSITSKYKNYLANEIEKLKKDFEENNEITITSKIIDKKSELKIKYKEEQLKAEITPFQVSRGAVKAIELLNEELYNRIFHQTELKDPINKIILIYRIYVQLIRKKELSSIKSDNEFWTSFCQYLLENNNGLTGSFFINSVKDFDFSPENIYSIKKIIGKNTDEIKPTNYSKICGTTGLVIFLIKDALEYCGIIVNDKKNIPGIVYKNLEYLETIEKKYEDYIDFLKK